MKSSWLKLFVVFAVVINMVIFAFTEDEEEVSNSDDNKELVDETVSKNEIIKSSNNKSNYSNPIGGGHPLFRKASNGRVSFRELDDYLQLYDILGWSGEKEDNNNFEKTRGVAKKAQAKSVKLKRIERKPEMEESIAEINGKLEYDKEELDDE